MGKPSIHPIIYRAQQEPRDKESFIWLHKNAAGKKVVEEYNGTSWEPVFCITDSFISLERVRPYLYKVTFDSVPDDNGLNEPVLSGCSSYVQDGKLYRNLDFNYDNAASFIVKTKDFEGMSFITGLEDSHLDPNKISQLPYRICDGVNNFGIKVSTHVLFDDWGWTGCGNKSVSLTKLPFLVLSKVKSMNTLAQDLNGVLTNLYASEGIKALGYLIQVLVTDGTTTCVLMPPISEGHSYIIQNISAHPKLSNFRWVDKATVTRSELQTRPTGVERYNMMPCALEDLRFTKAYEYPNRLSEFIGLRGTNKDSTDAELTPIYQDARTMYLDRKRDGNTWHTMHSVIYGDKMESLWVQENWNDNIIPSSELAEAISNLSTTFNAMFELVTDEATGAQFIRAKLPFVESDNI